MKPTIKKSSLLSCFQWIALLGILFSSGTPAVRAGLTLDINLYHDQYGYYTYGYLSATATLPDFPEGDYLIASPDYPSGGSYLLYKVSGGNLSQGIDGQYGSGNYYPDFNALLYGITNGTWSIWVTNGVTTKYQFHVAIPGLSSNAFGLPALVTYPLNNATAIPVQPAFTWTGPADWMGTLDVEVDYTEGENYSYVDSASLPPDTINWTPSVVLSSGMNSFSVSYNSNITALVSTTTPTNNTGEVISAWASTGNLNSRGWSEFTVSGSGFDQYLVARYDFEDADSAGHDSSGNNNDANCGSGNGGTNEDIATPDAAVGTLAREYFGDTSICFYPNGADCFNNLSNALLGSFSWTAWVKTTNSLNDDYANAYFGAPIWFEYSDPVNQIVFSITGSKAAFTVGNPDGGSDTTLHSTTGVNDGVYHFLAATRNEASGLMSLYVDGQLEATGVSTNGPRVASSLIYLAGGYNENFAGLLDDVRVYDVELSAADVAALSGHSTSGTTGGHTNIAYYSFEDGSLFSQDFSGHDNDIGGYSWSDEEPYLTNDAAAGSYAVGYTGSGWQNPPTNLVATLAGSFTVALWAKTTDEPGFDDDEADWDTGLFSANSDQAIPMAQTGSKLAFLTGGDNPATLHSTTSINTGEYVHLVVTRDQNSGQKKIYVNGTLDASDFGSPGVLTSSEEPILYLGQNSSFSGGFLGEMDEVQVYSGVLSDADVAYLYNHPGEAIADEAGGGGDFDGALNTTNLDWSSGGDAPWFMESTTALDGLAAQSGPITDDQASYLETTVPADGQISFNWKVSSEEGWDYLTFYINGDEQDAISGDVDWNEQTYFVSAGDVLRWEYSKDPDCCSDGLDAGFLDEVSYVSGPLNTNSAPIITINPFSQTNYPGYNVALLAAATSNPAATWQWFKVGTGLIASATNALFIPTNSGTAGVAGSYYAVASNFVGAATTLTATVAFVSAPLSPDWSRAFNEQLYNNFNDDTTNYNIACLIDSTGTNIYTVGSFVGTNSFGPDTLISRNSQFGSSFLKQTTTGTAIWGRSITNNDSGSSSYAQCIVTAPGNGFYVSGVINGTNWLGTNKLADVGGGSTYLARFDANGSNLWVRIITGTNANFTTYHLLASDPAGNVTLSALISGYTSFGNTNIFADGQRGVLVQYDANGNIRWLQMPSSWPDYLTYNGGRIYGSMGGSDISYIGGITNVSDRKQVLFSITATNGQGLWVRGVGAAQGQSSPNGFGDDNTLVAVSGTNVFITGSAYGSNAVFGAYTIALPATGRGQYFARYDTNGNAQLATSFGSQYTWPWAAVADASGNVYVGGDFDTYSTFGDKIIAAPFYDTVQSVGTIDSRIPGQGFVAKFDRNGNPLWARLAASQSSYLNSRDIALASDGIWSCGLFSQPSVFGSITISGSITVVGSPFGYIVYHPSGYLAKITDGIAASPVTLLNPKPVGVNFQFQFQSLSGFSHNILYRTNLATGTWLTNSTVSGDGTLKTISLPFSLFNPAKQGFIRVSTQ